MSNEGIGQVGEQIERLTRDAIQPAVISAPGQPNNAYYLINKSGVAELITPAPKGHSIVMESPAALLELVNRNIKDQFTAMPSPVVFVNPRTVVLYTDINARRDSAGCALVESEPLMWLKESSARPYSQADIVRILRIIFRGCAASDGVLSLIRNLKFDCNTSGEAEVQHGRESMGRQINASVRGIDAIPEELVLSVPAYRNYGYRASITCAIEISVLEKQFRITPYPGELDRAISEAVGFIQSDFSKIIPAFLGKE